MVSPVSPLARRHLPLRPEDVSLDPVAGQDKQPLAPHATSGDAHREVRGDISYRLDTDIFALARQYGITDTSWNSWDGQAPD